MAVMLIQEICAYRREVVLLDGSKAWLRPICEEDKAALQAFYSRLSEYTIYQRYQYVRGGLTEIEIKNQCEIDYYDHLTLVAEVERGFEKQIVGAGYYYRLPDIRFAEVAFIVQDNEQHKGIGTELLNNLAVLAWNNGILYFVGEVLRTNGRMLSVFRKFDPYMKNRTDDARTCFVTVSVAEAIIGTVSGEAQAEKCYLSSLR